MPLLMSLATAKDEQGRTQNAQQLIHIAIAVHTTAHKSHHQDIGDTNYHNQTLAWY